MAAIDYEQRLGLQAKNLLEYQCTTMPSSRLQLPGPDFVDRVLVKTDLPNPVLRNIQSIFDHGNLAGTGYLSILPVDQGIEHSGGRSFSPNPDYFDPENLIKLALEGGCNAVASTAAVLGSISRDYAHKIPMIMKYNHGDLLNDPKRPDQIIYASVEQAYNMGAVAVGATVYFGSPTFKERAQNVANMFQHAHERGMAAFLWTYVRNPEYPKFTNVEGASQPTSLEVSTELCAQANYAGAVLRPDFIKQKEPEFIAGAERMAKVKEQFGIDIVSPEVYAMLEPGHRIDMMRFLVYNCLAGRIPMLTSGGPAIKNESDDVSSLRTAIVNKRGGGIGEIMGRKAFQGPFNVGVRRIQSVQSVYSDPNVTIA